MANERVTIEVESNIGEDGPLTVMDTLDQFKDAFELLSAAIAAETGGEKIKWRLEKLSKNSPAKVTAVAYSPDPKVVVAPLVYHGKRRFRRDMSALREGTVSPWLRSKAGTAKAFMRRNLNGIGRTAFDFEEEGEPLSVVVEKTARKSLRALEADEGIGELADKSRSEFGTIDAHVTEAKTWNGKPAIYLKDRVSGSVFPCILSDDLAESAGGSHGWNDIWSGQRVRVKGQIFYDRTGAVSRVRAIDLHDVKPKPVDFASLRRINILDGKSPTEHLDELWGYADE